MEPQADAVPDAGAGAPASSAGGDAHVVGVGPWVGAWPDDPRYDPELLAQGDRRNVVDRYRYWTREAIVADLDIRRHPFHVAIENMRHDLNIGSVVRTANAFGAGEVHIVGRRRWNRRGAMVTDRYQHVRHHADVAALAGWASDGDMPVLGLDNVEGAVPLETFALPRRCLLLFGQEGTGLTPQAVSSGPPARSTWGPPPASPCTPGCGSTSSVSSPAEPPSRRRPGTAVRRAAAPVPPSLVPPPRVPPSLVPPPVRRRPCWHRLGTAASPLARPIGLARLACSCRT